MTLPIITLVGLGPGSPDALTLGALKVLKNPGNTPIYLRTRVHPTVAWLEENEGVQFAKAYDDIYNAADSFEQVYSSIAADVIASALSFG
jgi:tetrapyrrole methylase family protein/MazG family protein